MLRVLQVVTKMDRCGLETLLMNYYRNIDREIIQFDFLTHREEHGQYDNEIEQLGGNIYHVPPLNPLNPGYYKALDDFSGHIHIILCILIWIVRVHFRSVQLKKLEYPIG